MIDDENFNPVHNKWVYAGFSFGEQILGDLLRKTNAMAYVPDCNPNYMKNRMNVGVEVHYVDERFQNIYQIGK